MFSEDSMVNISTVLLPGVWVGCARNQHCNATSAFGSSGGRMCSLCGSRQKEKGKETEKVSFLI